MPVMRGTGNQTVFTHELHTVWWDMQMCAQKITARQGTREQGLKRQVEANSGKV